MKRVKKKKKQKNTDAGVSAKNKKIAMKLVDTTFKELYVTATSYPNI